ncbi:MAG TPA: Sapep family Mn(2+)-dependent dipeptidase [Anaerovoracaceae bacterium]|nr:Sapep family Mn(2+)-dependent dipeptidase [Anaerovoracaceae bacterium]
MIKHLQELIAIPSVTCNQGGEKPFGDVVPQALTYVLNLCKSFGFRTKNCDGMIGYAEIGEGSDIVGILCHLDVVPAGNDWTYPPFKGEIHDGKIYGRGAIDDKGPAMAAIFAMKDILDAGIKLDKRVRIIFGQTEEDGDWIDIDYYKEHEEIPTVGFTPDADFPAIYGEKGIITLKVTMALKDTGFEYIKGGNASNMVPDYAECTINGETISKKGVSAHGSTPWDGDNAITSLMKKVVELGVDSPLATFYMKKIGDNLYGEKIGIGLKDEQSGKLTFNVGTINTVGNNVEMEIDIRYPVTYSLEDVMLGIEPEIRDSIKCTIKVMDHMRPVYMDKDGEVIGRLLEAYREVTGDMTEPSVMGGGTYARGMDNIVAFGPVFPGRECTEHQKDEYAYVEDLEKACEIYKKAIIKLCKI